MEYPCKSVEGDLAQAVVDFNMMAAEIGLFKKQTPTIPGGIILQSLSSVVAWYAPPTPSDGDECTYSDTCTWYGYCVRKHYINGQHVQGADQAYDYFFGVPDPVIPNCKMIEG